MEGLALFWRKLSALRERLPSDVTPELSERAHRALSDNVVGRLPLRRMVQGARPYEDVVWLFMSLEQAEHIDDTDLRDQWVAVPREQSERVAAHGGAKHVQFSPKAAQHAYCVRVEIILGRHDDSESVSTYVYVHDPKSMRAPSDEAVSEIVARKMHVERAEALRRMNELTEMLDAMGYEEALAQCAAITGMAPRDIQLWCQNRVRHCAGCRVNGMEFKKCSGCKRVHYCSEACQRAHWKIKHRHECESRK
jgi:hypothetical protein